MMIRSVVTLASAAAIALAVGLVSRSAAASHAPIPLLRVGVPFSITNLDIARPGNGLEVAPLVLETLVVNGADLKVHPWLAASWSQPTPTEYVFKLRHGVKFSDGVEMTSADVENALNYYRYPAFQSMFGDLFTRIKSVKATDKYTVVVRLRKANAPFLSRIAVNARIFEKKFQQEHKDTFGKPGTLLIGTAPWVVTSLDPTSGLNLVANPYYWGGKVGIQRITYSFFKDETSEALAFRAGDIDIVPRVTGQRAFAAAANTKLLSGSSCREGYLIMPTTLRPWNDVHVRRAVAYAINRADIIAGTVGTGYAVPQYTFITPSQLQVLASPAEVKAALKSVPTNALDLAKAKQELAQSAYPNGFTFDFFTANLTVWPLGTQIVANQLSKIGIHANVKILSLGAWVDRAYGKPADHMINFITSTCENDPGYYFNENVGSKGTNFTNYSKADALISQGLSTANPTQRLGVYIRILKQLATDVPVVPIFNQLFSSALSTKFTWPTFSETAYNGGGMPWALGIKAA